MRYFGMAYGCMPVEFIDGEWRNALGHQLPDDVVISKAYANNLIEYLKRED